MAEVGTNIYLPYPEWSFGGDVPRAFDEHVRHSIPFYNEGHKIIEGVSDFFMKEDSRVYDLGASTGVLLHRLSLRKKNEAIQFLGIDREPGMVEEASKKCDSDGRLQFICDDIRTTELRSADLIISYYTIQFLRAEDRRYLIEKIYQSLNERGAFIWFEKVRAGDAFFQDIINGLNTDYKEEQGFSGAEILAKSRSLRGILDPNTSEQNLDLLKMAGFAKYAVLMKYLNFEGILAVK